AGHGVEPGFGQGDVPVLGVAGAADGRLRRATQAQAEVGAGEVVIEEVALDDPALVTQAEDEVGETVLGEALHDVPQDRPAADGDHRLGDVIRHVADAGALAAAQDGHLHASPPPSRTASSAHPGAT